jgi:cobalamin biosynthesis protein CobD/CbiB
LPDLPLRDFTYEKLCALTKAARLYDSQMRPEAETEWEFAAAVLKLNRHPMSWLLRWAGLKDENEKRPWWDRWLLVGTALMAVLLFVGGGVVVAIIAEGHSELWERLVWAAAGCCYAAAAVGVYFFIRRIENGQAKQRVERCRRNLTHSGVISHFPGSEGAPS